MSGAGTASAAICLGNCGFLNAPDGVVDLSPQGGTYGYVTTAGGLAGAGQISNVGGTNGSQYSTDTFSANAGDSLQFYFNYVTSDGSGFSDYAWARLSTSLGQEVGYLFTARTTPDSDTSPGFGLPPNISTLNPSSTVINPNQTTFSPLAGSSGGCYASGCGYTGWIQSSYAIQASGDYVLTFGVTNFADGAFQSALAFDGATIAGTVIGGGGGVGTVPLPASAPLFGAALVAIGAVGLGRGRRTSAKAA